MLIGVCRIGGFGFDIKNAGFTFVYVSGRELIAFDFGFWPLNLSVREAENVDETGCWKTDIPVPWHEIVAVVAEGLWSMLSTADVVNKPFCKMAGQTTSSSIN